MLRSHTAMVPKWKRPLVWTPANTYHMLSQEDTKVSSHFPNYRDQVRNTTLVTDGETSACPCTSNSKYSDKQLIQNQIPTDLYVNTERYASKFKYVCRTHINKSHPHVMHILTPHISLSRHARTVRSQVYISYILKLVSASRSCPGTCPATARCSGG